MVGRFEKLEIYVRSVALHECTPRSTTEFATFGRISKDVADAVGECCRVGRRNVKSGDAVLDELGESSDLRGDNRSCARKCLDNHHRKAFIPDRRNHDHGRASHFVQHRVPRQSSEHGHVWARKVLNGGKIGAGARNPQRVAPACASLHKIPDTLLRA